MRSGKIRFTRFRPRLGRVFMAIFLIYASLTLGYQQIKIMGLTRQVNQMEAAIETAKERNDLLAQEIQRVGSDEYIEQVAREQLGLTKPGELPYIPAVLTAEQK